MWPEKPFDRISGLLFGVVVLPYMVSVLLDPRGGIPIGDARGDDPGYFVLGAVYFIVGASLVVLASVGPRRRNESWERAARVLGGLAFIALGLTAYLNRYQSTTVGDPRNEPWFWPGILAWLTAVGVAISLSAFLPERR
jgi:hypothetical protein